MGKHPMGTMALYIRASVALASCGLAGRATAVTLATTTREKWRALDDGLRDLMACRRFAFVRFDREGEEIAKRAIDHVSEAREAADRECAAADAPMWETP